MRKARFTRVSIHVLKPRIEASAGFGHSAYFGGALKAVVQRVKNASVRVDGKTSGSIERGLLVYLGVARADSEKDAEWMAEKIANLRIFDDAGGKMNLPLKEVSARNEEGAGVLAVSQFTLLADARKGRRPYYGGAADPEKAKALYGYFMEKVREEGLVCEAGVFQARMEVSYTNDGPVTIILDTAEENKN